MFYFESFDIILVESVYDLSDFDVKLCLELIMLFQYIGQPFAIFNNYVSKLFDIDFESCFGRT